MASRSRSRRGEPKTRTAVGSTTAGRKEAWSLASSTRRVVPVPGGSSRVKSRVALAAAMRRRTKVNATSRRRVHSKAKRATVRPKASTTKGQLRRSGKRAPQTKSRASTSARQRQKRNSTYSYSSNLIGPKVDGYDAELDARLLLSEDGFDDNDEDLGISNANQSQGLGSSFWHGQGEPAVVLNLSALGDKEATFERRRGKPRKVPGSGSKAATRGKVRAKGVVLRAQQMRNVDVVDKKLDQRLNEMVDVDAYLNSEVAILGDGSSGGGGGLSRSSRPSSEQQKIKSLTNALSAAKARAAAALSELGALKARSNLNTQREHEFEEEISRFEEKVSMLRLQRDGEAIKVRELRYEKQQLLKELAKVKAESRDKSSAARRRVATLSSALERLETEVATKSRRNAKEIAHGKALLHSLQRHVHALSSSALPAGTGDKAATGKVAKRGSAHAVSRILLTLEQTLLAISDGEAGFYGGAEPTAKDGGKADGGAKKQRHNATDVHDGLILVLEDEARDWEDEARRLRGELDIKNAELIEIRRRAKAFDVLPQYRAAVFKARSLAQSLRLRLAEEQNEKELLKQQLEDARVRVEEGFRAMEMQSDRFVSAIGARMRAGKKRGGENPRSAKKKSRLGKRRTTPTAGRRRASPIRKAVDPLAYGTSEDEIYLGGMGVGEDDLMDSFLDEQISGAMDGDEQPAQAAKLEQEEDYEVAKQLVEHQQQALADLQLEIANQRKKLESVTALPPPSTTTYAEDGKKEKGAAAMFVPGVVHEGKSTGDATHAATPPAKRGGLHRGSVVASKGVGAVGGGGGDGDGDEPSEEGPSEELQEELQALNGEILELQRSLAKATDDFTSEMSK